MKRPWDAVVWWEIRRIPFNLIILVVGFASGFAALFFGSRTYGRDTDFGNPFLSAVLYGIAANFCYTFGWVTELLWCWGNTAQTETVRPKVFRAGLIFSVGVTMLPAAILSLVWAAHSFR
jgi:hypothetical protein